MQWGWGRSAGARDPWYKALKTSVTFILSSSRKVTPCYNPQGSAGPWRAAFCRSHTFCAATLHGAPALDVECAGSHHSLGAPSPAPSHWAGLCPLAWFQAPDLFWKSLSRCRRHVRLSARLQRPSLGSRGPRRPGGAERQRARAAEARGSPAAREQLFSGETGWPQGFGAPAAESCAPLMNDGIVAEFPQLLSSSLIRWSWRPPPPNPGRGRSAIV